MELIMGSYFILSAGSCQNDARPWKFLKNMERIKKGRFCDGVEVKPAAQTLSF
jgi:hypothetical protein